MDAGLSCHHLALQSPFNMSNGTASRYHQVFMVLLINKHVRNIQNIRQLNVFMCNLSSQVPSLKYRSFSQSLSY